MKTQDSQLTEKMARNFATAQKPIALTILILNLHLQNIHHMKTSTTCPSTPLSSKHAVMRRIQMLTAVALIFIIFFWASYVQAATKTWVPTAGGAWTTSANWSPSGAPAANDIVIISSNQSAAITAVPTISLTTLTISGNCNLTPASAGNTLTVTGTFSVSAGITLSLGTNGSNTRLNLTLGSACVGSVLGTLNVYTSSTNAVFTNNGDLTLGSAALITDGGGSNNSDFILAATGILRIGSVYGISTGTTQGATVGNIQVTGTRTYTAGADYEYNGTAAQVTGSGLTQNSPAILTINNSAGVTLSAATTISGLLTMTNGTLDMANTNLSVGSLTGSGNLTHSSGTAGARTLTIGTDNTSPAAYSGIISNGTATSVAVTKSGTGTLTLSGSNTFSGTLTIQKGTLSVPTVNNAGSAGPFGQSTSPVVLGYTTGSTAGTLEYTGSTASSTKPFNIDYGGVAQIDVSGTVLTLSGQINQTGAGLLTKTGPGTLTIAGTDDNGGLGVVANAGTVVLAKTSNSGVHAIGGAGLTSLIF